LKNEAKIHRQLRHPNIVSMLGVVFETNHYGLIFELVTYGSWINFMKKVTENSSKNFLIIQGIQAQQDGLFFEYLKKS